MKVLHGENTIEASDAAGIVEKMRAGSFEGSRDLAEYMDQVAARIKAQMGKPVRTRRAEDFIEDLAGLGILEKVG